MNRCALRRKLLFALAATILVARPAGAQPQTKVHRIGYLVNEPLAEPPTRERAAFLQGLRELGYREGANLEIEYRSSESNPEFLPDLAAELVARHVDVIVALAEASVRVAMKATQSIPIVFIAGIDPVRGGIARSLARPGGNVTGITLMLPDLEAKRLELLRALLPHARRIAVLRVAQPRALPPLLADTLAATRQLGMTLESHAIRDLPDLTATLDRIARSRPDALLVRSDARLIAARGVIAKFALEKRIPSIMGVTDFAREGGLAAYATNVPAQFRRLASYVDRIFKGAWAGELPIEQPTKFEMIINLRTAKALEITIPQAVLVRADEVVE